MKESSTYQAILEKGYVEAYAEAYYEGMLAEAKRILRLLGDDAFGPPDARTAARIERINDVARLEELVMRMLTATSWQELLRRPAPCRKSGRRPTPSGAGRLPAEMGRERNLAQRRKGKSDLRLPWRLGAR